MLAVAHPNPWSSASSYLPSQSLADSRCKHQASSNLQIFFELIFADFFTRSGRRRERRSVVTAFLSHEWMSPSPTLALTLCLLLSGSHALGPRVISQEEILTVVDDWLYAVDEDEDGSVSEAEAPALLDLLKQGSSAMGAENFGVDVLMRMADGDGDKVASRAELIDFLKRMKATATPSRTIAVA